MLSKLLMKVKRVSGIFEVALLSASSFLVSYSLLNFASQRDYGVYVNIFSVLMLAQSMQYAMILTPLSVRAAKIENTQNKKQYIGDYYIVQLSVSAFMILLGLLASLITAEKRWLFIALFFVSYLSREFFRTREYVYQRFDKLIVLGAIYFLCASFGISLFVFFDCFNLNNALGIVSVASIIVIFLFVKNRKITMKTEARHAKQCFMQCWSGGKWNLVGSLATWFQNNTFAYLTSIMLGVEATASLAAAKLLLLPINLMNNGIYASLKPSWAKMYQSDPLALRSKSINITIFMMLFILFYYLALYVMWQFITSYVVRGETVIDFKLLSLWVVAFLVQALKFRLSTLLIVAEDFKYLARIGVPIAVLSVCLTWVFIQLFGVVGVVFGYISGEIIHACCSFIRTRNWRAIKCC